MEYKFNKFENVKYKKINNSFLELDIYTPASMQYKSIPCAVFFHGGGWRQGSRKDLWGFPLIIDALISNGIAVASASYRLYGVNAGKFPDSVEDCLDALIYLDCQKEVKIDKKHKAVFGISAGGYMALMSAFYQDIAKKYTPITAIADICGPVFMKGNGSNFLVNTPPMTQRFIDDFIGTNDFCEMCNPIEIIKTSSVRPNLLIVHGELDECVDPEGSRLLYLQARAKGLYTEYIEVENALHTFGSGNAKPIKPKTQDLFKQIGEFILDNI